MVDIDSHVCACVHSQRLCTSCLTHLRGDDKLKITNQGLAEA
jgi:hypothetical protein